MYSDTSSQTFDLARDATLLRVSISCFTGSKKDKITQGETADSHNANEERISVILKLLAKDDYGPIQAIGNEARAYLNEQGAVWDKDGNRLIPNVKLVEVEAKLDEYRIAFEDAVCQLLGRYDQLADAARRGGSGLGHLLDRVGGFPDKGLLAGKYKFEVLRGVFTDPADIRLNSVSPAQRQRIQDAVRHDYEGKVMDIHRQVVDRITIPLQRLVTQLKGFEDGTIARFEDSLVGNILEQCEVLPSLNITNDRTIAETIDKARALASSIDLQKLRARAPIAKPEAGAKPFEQVKGSRAVTPKRVKLTELPKERAEVIREARQERKEVVTQARSLLEKLQAGNVTAKI